MPYFKLSHGKNPIFLTYFLHCPKFHLGKKKIPNKLEINFGEMGIKPKSFFNCRSFQQTHKFRDPS